MTALIHPSTAFETLEPEALKNGISVLLATYQDTRSGLVACFVARYAQALCRHPEFEGSYEERCAWHRMAGHWRWLAQAPYKAAVLDGRAVA